MGAWGVGELRGVLTDLRRERNWTVWMLAAPGSKLVSLRRLGGRLPCHTTGVMSLLGDTYKSEGGEGGIGIKRGNLSKTSLQFE